MKLSIVQKNINDQYFIEVLDYLKDSDTELVLFGELAVSGCLYNGLENRKIETADMLFEKFKEYPFSVMIGMPRLENDRLYNSYLYFDDSSYQIYNKINLFEPMNETKHFIAGEKEVVFDFNSKKIGASICYDIRFPKLYSNLQEQGAEYIVIPAAFPRVRIHVWKELLKERAIQTNLTVIGINSVGDDGTNEFGGSSMVIAPDGSIIAQADEINETIIEVEL